MGRISQYPLDTDIQGNDKWIGTSVNNANSTKNFSVDTVAEYLNKSAAVDSQALRYTYQNVQGDDVRLASTISFIPSLGDNVPFTDITEWVISAFAKQIKDVRTYYDAPLVGKTILITNAFNPSNWAIFRWDSVVEDIDDPNFYHIGLTYIQSTGELVAGQDYLIALLDASSGGGGSAIWGDITGIISNQTDLQDALDAKQDTLVSGTNIKTINGSSILGSGNLTITTSATWGSITGTLSAQTDLQSALNAKVPYTGAVANVDLGEFELKAGQVEFDQTPTGANGVGVMRWNDTDGTVDLLLKGGNVTLQVGQEQVTRVVNKSGTDFLEANYQAVRINGAQGNRIRVALALADSDANSAETLGLVTETIANNQEGFVTSSGLIRNINTTGSLQSETWVDGDTLYLSGTVLGAITNIKPTAPVHTVIIGYVVRVHATQGQIYVKVDNGYELGELHNVSVNGAVDKDILQYDGVTTLWESVSLSGAGIQSTLVSGTNIKTINGTSLLGSGNIVISASAAWGSITGTLSSQTDLQSALNAKQDTLVSGTNIKTINGSSVLGSGNLVVSAGASGVAGAVQFSDGSGLSSDANAFKWDNTNKMLALGLGGFAPSARLHVVGTGTTSATQSFKAQNSNGSKLVYFDDAGNLIMQSSGSNIFIAAATGVKTYNIASLGGWGLSQVNMTGLMDLYSNDGNLAIRINNAYTGIVDPTAIGQFGAPNASAMLDVVSTTSGLLPPRMTTVQKNAIATPAAGLIVYDTTTNKLCCYNGTIWNDLF